MSLPSLMTARQTAAYLGVSLRTLIRWAKHHVGPPRLQIGKKTLYTVDGLLLWLEAHEASRTEGAK